MVFFSLAAARSEDASRCNFLPLPLAVLACCNLTVVNKSSCFSLCPLLFVSLCPLLSPLHVWTPLYFSGRLLTAAVWCLFSCVDVHAAVSSSHHDVLSQSQKQLQEWAETTSYLLEHQLFTNWEVALRFLSWYFTIMPWLPGSLYCRWSMLTLFWCCQSVCVFHLPIMWRMAARLTKKKKKSSFIGKRLASVTEMSGWDEKQQPPWRPGYCQTCLHADE